MSTENASPDPDGPFRVRYTFAGASGTSKSWPTVEEATREGDKLYDHYHGIAKVWLENSRGEVIVPRD